MCREENDMGRQEQGQGRGTLACTPLSLFPNSFQFACKDPPLGLSTVNLFNCFTTTLLKLPLHHAPITRNWTSPPHLTSSQFTGIAFSHSLLTIFLFFFLSHFPSLPWFLIWVSIEDPWELFKQSWWFIRKNWLWFVVGVFRRNGGFWWVCFFCWFPSHKSSKSSTW